jgi:hypothetical protein
MRNNWIFFAKLAAMAAIGGLLVGLIGGLLGLLISKISDPTGWSDLIDSLGGAIFGYGIGSAVGAYLIHRRNGGSHGFMRALLSSLTGLFAVIFLSEPLHLGATPVLMWVLLILIPPLVTSGMIHRSNPKEVE